MMSYSSAGIQSEAFNERESNSQIFSECQIHIQFQNLNLTQTKKKQKKNTSVKAVVVKIRNQEQATLARKQMEKIPSPPSGLLPKPLLQNTQTHTAWLDSLLRSVNG